MKMKKWIPYLLTLTMVLGILPASVYATDEITATQEISGIETADESDAGSTKITVNGQTFENNADGDANTISESFTQTETNEETQEADTVKAVATISASSNAVASIAAVVDGTCGDNATWEYDDSTYTLTIGGTGAMADYDYDSQPWYSYQSDIQTIVIGSGVTSIGDYAFCDCDSLTSVTIPSTVERIGAYSFEGCEDLSSFTIPEGVKYIEEWAFDMYASGTIVIPSSVESIGNYVFGRNVIQAFSVDVDNQYYCDVDGVLMNKAATKLVQYPGAKSGTSYTIPDRVETIGTGAFYVPRSELVEITFADSVKTLEASAFDECNFESLVLPSNLESIGEWCFLACAELKSVTMPVSLKSIGAYAFNMCYSLQDIYYEGSEADWSQITIISELEDELDWNFLEYEPTIHYNWVYEDAVTWSYEPSTYTLTISGTGAMDDYEYGEQPWWSYREEIQYAVIESGVTSIGDLALWGLYNLKTVSIPSSVVSIGAEAFQQCELLQSIELPSGLKSIGQYAFSGCVSITNITIPSAVESIGNSAFACIGLQSISVDSENKYYTDICGVLLNKAETELIQYPLGNYETSYLVPTSVTSIGDYAFASCIYLTDLTILSNVTSIGEEAIWTSNEILNIYGYSGTAAETYAEMFGSDINFIALDEVDAIDLGTVVQYIPFEMILSEYIPYDKYSMSSVALLDAAGNDAIWCDWSVIGGTPTTVGTVILMAEVYVGESLETLETLYFSLEVEAVEESHEDELTDVGYEVTTPLPNVIDLDNAQDYTFVSQGPFSEFQNVYMNGERLTENTDYTAVEGSTKITIKAQTFANNTVEGNNVIAAEFLNSADSENKYAVQVFTTEESTGSTGGSFGGGGGSSSSSSSSSSSDEADESIVEFTTADNELQFAFEVDVEIVDGKAMVSLTLDMLLDLLAEMAESEGDVPMQLLITLPELDASVQSANVSLPMDLLAAITDLENTSLAIDMQHIGIIEFGDTSLDDIMAQGGEEFAFDLSRDPVTEILLQMDDVTLDDIELKIALPNLTDGDVVVFVVDEETTIIKKSAMTSDCAYALLVGSGVVDAMYNARTFDDIQNNSSITAMSARGLFMGTGDNQFTANGSMTRAMIASVLHRLEDNEATTGAGSFTDVVAGEWYEAGVNWAAEKGIVVGYGDGIFGATDEITVEQIIVFLYRYADYSDMNTTQRGDVTSFGDTSAWSTEQIKWAVATGILTDSNAQPQDVATRAQGAELFDRFIGLMVE